MHPSIPGFNPLQARRFVEEFEDSVVRGFVHLSLIRDIDNVRITSKRFLEQQQNVMPHLQKVLSSQLGNGGWLTKEEDLKMPLYKSTHWILNYLGYLGLSGIVISEVENAVEYAHANLRDDDGLYSNTGTHYGGFLECNSAIFLGSLLRLGFHKSLEVKEDCLAHLNRISDEEGHCRYKKGGTPCGYVSVKNLVMFNEFPKQWRGKMYKRSVKNIQEFLLRHDLSTADYPRTRENPNKHWFNFAHFRSFQASVFQGAEALVLSGVKDHPVLKNALDFIGSKCIDGITWKAGYVQQKFPLRLESKKPSPWLTLRGLRIHKALSA